MSRLGAPAKRIYVGIVGPHGRGKSTLADAVERNLIRIFTLWQENGAVDGEFLQVSRVNFADALRNETLSGVSYQLSREKQFAKERVLLQAAGELERSVNSAHFISRYLKQVDVLASQVDDLDSDASGGLHVIITDDAYHFNEAGLMDLLFVIDDREAVNEHKDKLENCDGYQPSESELQMLEQMRLGVHPNPVTVDLALQEGALTLSAEHQVVVTRFIVDMIAHKYGQVMAGNQVFHYGPAFQSALEVLSDAYPEIDLEPLVAERNSAYAYGSYGMVLRAEPFISVWTTAVERLKQAGVPERSPEPV